MSVLRWIGRALGFLFLIAVIAPAVGFVALCFAVDLYGRQERATPADAIVVLGARVLPDGTPGPDLAPRTEKAVWLYQRGYATRIICTGGAAGDRLSAAAVAARLAADMGVTGDAILLADGSNNTREDALRTAEVMASQGLSRVIVVSHPLHLLRTTILFRRAGLEVYPSPTSTEVREIPFRWRAFYSAREAGLIAMDMVYPDGQYPPPVRELQRWLRLTEMERYL